MAYNIEHTEYLSGKLFIRRKKAVSLMLRYLQEQMPEGNFIDGLSGPKYSLCGKGEPDDLLEIKAPWWYGERSGRLSDDFLNALEECEGEADILVVWEGGDKINGVRVEHGKARWMDAEIRLVEESPDR